MVAAGVFGMKNLVFNESTITGVRRQIIWDTIAV